MSNMIPTRIAYGEALAELGADNEKIVVLDADVSMATFTCKFRDAFPERHLNFGIAEANMMGAAAGLADLGYIPFASCFCVFLGRAYDQIRNTIAYGDFNVKIALTHGGVTAGQDGASHHAIEDIALARVIPNMVVLCPCDANQVRKALRVAAEYKGPVYLRFSRMPSPVYDEKPFELAGSNVMRDGKDVVLFTYGYTVSQCLEAAQLLWEKGIDAAVVDLYSIKPLDCARVLEYAKKCGKVVSVEEHSIIGGVGDAISEVLGKEYPCRIKRIGVPDCFSETGVPKDVIEYFGLDGAGIAETVSQWLKTL